LEKPAAVNFDGISLKPLLKDSGRNWVDRSIVVQNQRVDFAVKYKEFQVLTDKWRLINPYQKEIEDMEKFYAGESQGEVKYNPYKDRYELYDINSDPQQKENIAAQHPDVVKDLAQKYETWWDDVSHDFNEYPEIIIGSEKENPVTLYNHDAHRKNKKQYWVIHVAKDGKYSLKLRRWPEVSKKRIAENRKGDQKVSIRQAVLQVGTSEVTTAVGNDDFYIDAEVHLKAGQTCLSSWFERADGGRPIPADFISVEYSGIGDPEKLAAYQPSNPDDLLK
jgi:hypothetical protein